MTTLHITSGDSAGGLIKAAGFGGDILVWRDMLYEGRRNQGWPDETTLDSRAQMLSASTGGGLSPERIRKGLTEQYNTLKKAGDYHKIILWFDSCLYDMSMLTHILSCLYELKPQDIQLVCVDSYPGISPFNGLGQLNSDQFRDAYKRIRKVSDAQFQTARKTDSAFASQNMALFKELSETTDPEFPWIAPAVKRWMEEQPDPGTGLGKLEKLILEGLRNGHSTPKEIFKFAAAHDTHPQYWGDTSLWKKMNELSERGLVEIKGPAKRLPQWESEFSLDDFSLALSS